MTEVKVIGAGLAGSEAAWQLAERGFAVRLYVCDWNTQTRRPPHKPRSAPRVALISVG